MVAAEVEALIDRRRAREHNRAVERWSERSVWLITYADHFPMPDRTPLAGLHHFITEHLDAHVDGVHVLPFAPWSSDGGFSVIDYEAVDERYGTWADVERLAADRPVMFDAVINHMSAESPWFQGFLAGDPAYRGFFRVSDPEFDHSTVVRPRTHPLLAPFTTASGDTLHVWTTFSPDQVDLDYAEPAVLLRILDVLIDYCEHGASAIRLDAIGFLWKDPATTSIHLPQTHQLIQVMRSCLDEVAPGTILISETNVPHAENISYLGDDTPEVHAVYQFPLAPLAAHAALTGDASVLERWAGGIDEIVGQHRSFLNFLACHDGVGVRPAEGLLDQSQLAVLIDACRAAGGRVNERTLPDGSTAPYELNATWFELMAAGVDEAIGIERHLATHALMFALPGIATIYANALVGRSNDLEAVARTDHARDINRARFDDRAALDAELADESSRSRKIFDGLAELVALRRSSPAFHPEGSMRILPSPDGVIAVERRHSGASAAVFVNFGGSPVDLGAALDPAWTTLADGVAPPSFLARGGSLWLDTGS